MLGLGFVLGSMKILYVGNFTEIDSPLGYCPNAEWISDTFEELGHKVIRVNERNSSAYDVLKELRGADLLLTEEGRLDGDFSNDGSHDIIVGKFARVMDRAKALGIPTVPWLTNIFWGIMRREIQIQTNPIFKADIVFSTDGGHDKEFKDAGVNHKLLRQGIYGPEAYIGTPTYNTRAKVGFIGSIYEEIWPYRAKMVTFLKSVYGENFGHFGARGEIRHDELNNLIATLKIVVGDTVYSPNYWSNRIYEMLGRGAFLIHPMVPGLEEEFIPYKHFIPFNFGDLEGLKDKIDYYLAHDEERHKIQMAGFEYCKEHHTYEKRVKKLLQTLNEEGII